MEEVNILAYYDTAIMTVVKSFIVLAPIVSMTKIFFFATNKL
jgi:hypothetical protein